MAKHRKHHVDEPSDLPAEPLVEHPAEEMEYVIAVVKRQAGLDDKAAAELVAKLSCEQFTEMHDSGKAGKGARCREIIAEAQGEA